MCAQIHTNKHVCGTHTQTHLQKPEEEMDVLLSHFAPYSLRQGLSPNLDLLQQQAVQSCLCFLTITAL